MLQIIVLACLMGLASGSAAQLNRAVKLYDYRPAPGQFINLPGVGTPGAAAAMPLSPDSMLSLGSFGGTVVYGFEHPVYNHPDHPYGVDFTIFGNPFTGASEPGIVWVMDDLNGNGLPDDTWYEIAGSSHFHPLTQSNYTITWYREPDGSARWKDSSGEEGYLRKNSYYTQNYFPDKAIFTHTYGDSLRVEGTLLPYVAELKNSQAVLPVLAFGYADNRSVNRQVSPHIPDNPYTPLIREGAGGDAIDIAWAIDSAGNYVDLEKIHFVRITTGILSVVEPVGEASTEIVDIVATTPGSGTSTGNLLVIHPHQATMLQGDTLQLYGTHFVSGRFAGAVDDWSTNHSDLIRLGTRGEVVAVAGGDALITASAGELSSETSLRIRVPDKVELNGWSASLLAGQRLTVQPRLLDQYNQPVGQQRWVVSAQPENRLNIVVAEETIYLQALETGKVTLTLHTLRFPSVQWTAELDIRQAPEKVTILASAKLATGNIFPLQPIEVTAVNLNPYFESPASGYSSGDFVHAAHALHNLLSESVTDFALRSDSMGTYLYKIEQEGLYTYGWGGRIEPIAFARSWMIALNGALYAQGFEKLALQEGDTLHLFHVSDLRHPFEVTALYASPASAGENDRVTLRQVTRKGWLAGTKFHTVPDTTRQLLPVFVNDDLHSAGQLPTNGTLEIELLQSPPLIIHAGADAVKIFTEPVTSLQEIQKPLFTLWPNPAHTYIHIGGIDKPFRCRITGISGVLYVDRWLQPGETLDITGLSAGIYLVTAGEGPFYSTKLVVR